MTEPGTTPDFRPTATMTNAVLGSSALDQPLYGASFGAAIKRLFKKYAVFSGRASRSEYWWVALLNVAVISVLTLAGVLTEDRVAFSAIYFIYMLVTLVPSIAVSIRRLHDSNMSGAFILLNLVPGVGALVFAILMIMPSSPMGARFDIGRQPL